MTPAEAPSPGLVATELDRTAEHLRQLAQPRLARRHQELAGASAADAAHGFAQWLAATAAGLTAGTAPPADASVPRLSDFAVGDQVAVTGRELIAAVTAARDGNVTAVLGYALERTRILRRVT